MLSYNSSKFGGHKHCGSEDIMNIPANTEILPQIRNIRDYICLITPAIIFSLKHMACATRI